ncbi:hypothetical protein S2M10_17960 [Sphingomonas sp. S2M10]|uniref:MarR family transcriptional regulator n=1 Tax=Sphingomonas sp. S2M10 TaxID=2705010 RepID=UPI0016B91F9F|nr:MarR family transcriptional regulator [Sphingomonas sp. S2M10]NLS26809.1 hypothetical protein [Sphingomonas sp. S2M10]
MGQLHRARALVQMLADELELPSGMASRVLLAAPLHQDLLPNERDPRGEGALAVVVRRYAKLRRKRIHYLHADVFADPAWDIMLDLFAASLEGKTVSVSSACIAADVPSTTALRWLSVLERERMIERVSDPNDRRRTFVRLMPLALEGVQAWFEAMLDSLKPSHRHGAPRLVEGGSAHPADMEQPASIVIGL